MKVFFSLSQAPYLPWVLLGFSLLLGNSVSVDLLGMAVGHVYYFLEVSQERSMVISSKVFLIFRSLSSPRTCSPTNPAGGGS